MTEKALQEKRALAQEVVVPIVVKLLSNYSSEDMTRAIKENLDLSELLSKSGEYLDSIRSIVGAFPSSSEVVPLIKRRAWICWFLNSQLKKERPDLFSVIVYTPGGTDYIVGQVKKLVDVIFS